MKLYELINSVEIQGGAMIYVYDYDRDEYTEKTSFYNSEARETYGEYTVKYIYGDDDDGIIIELEGEA
jgi:hypothetical protein